MSIAALIRQMVDAGAPPEAIAVAVAAIEDAWADDVERRRKRAEQKARERERRATVARQVCDSRATDPPEQKEPSPPTPPLLEKLNPPSCASLRSALVDEPVDPQPPNVKQLERAESDEKLLDQVTDAWNAWARGHRCPQVKFLTKSRAQHCRNRLKDIANGDEPLAAFRKVLSKCETSFFIRGSPRSHLKFDQLMREGFLSQMLEGAFEYQERRTAWRS